MANDSWRVIKMKYNNIMRAHVCCVLAKRMQRNGVLAARVGIEHASFSFFFFFIFTATHPFRRRARRSVKRAHDVYSVS